MQWVALIVLLVALGLILMLLGFIFNIAAYIGYAVLISTEFIANGFTIIGVDNPIVAWLLLGILVGGLTGLALGFRKAGYREDASKGYIAVAIAIIILLIVSIGMKEQTIQGTKEALAAIVEERKYAAFSIISINTCLGQYSDNTANCRPESSQRRVGIRFNYSGAVPNQTVTTIRWFRNGSPLETWSMVPEYSSGYIWHHYQSPNSNPLSPGTYEAILYAGDTERGRGSVVVPQPRTRTTPPTQADRLAPEASTRRSTGPSTQDHIRRTRTHLEAREYERALEAAEQAVRLEPDNRVARALRDQIRGMMRARAHLEAREYRQALDAAEQAARLDPSNRAARALRDEIQGMIKILNP